MEAWRGTFEAHWQEVAEVVLPRESNTFQGFRTPGAKQTEKQFDATAASALDRFTSVMDSMSTPQNSKWHRLKSTDSSLNKNPRVRRYFEDANNILFDQRYVPRANFNNQKLEEYTSLGAFGTGALFVTRRMPTAKVDPRGGLRYRSIHLAELFIAENFQGNVDKVHRKFNMTRRQVVQEFGKDKLPAKFLELAEKTPESEVPVLHCVKPRADMDPSKADHRGMPFASYHVLPEEKVLLREGGYDTMPYIVSRYRTASREVYGRSPAMMVLPAIKVLNEQKKTSLKVGHRLADPIILASDDGVLDAFSLKPGTQVSGAIDSSGRKLVSTLDMPAGQLQAVDKMMEYERQAINDAFMITLFQILVETPQMTATEVLERTREKGILLAPTMGRHQTESLAPMIERELDILADMQMLPDMPPELVEAQGEYGIEYDSPLSRAMRAEEAAGFFRMIEQTSVVANVTQDPSIFDHYNFEAAIPEIADIQAVPAAWMATAEQIDAKRQGRQQQVATQQMIDAGPAAAAMIKNVQPR